MKKKVIDIIPPEGYFSPFQEKGSESVSKITSQPPIEKKSGSGGWFLFFVLLFILAGAFCYFNLSKADIIVWPKTEPVELGTKLTVDINTQAANVAEKVIPGQIFEKEKTTTERFPATGKLLKEKKAEGLIAIYNETTAAQTLAANTRFVSTEGKLFRIQKAVTVPGGKYEKGKIVPGEVSSKVIADQPGPDFNIPPSTFSIPGFAGSDKYTKFYAKSFTAMEGGVLEQSSQVTEKDLEDAKEVVTDKAKKECEDSFKNELSTIKTDEGYLFLEKSVETNIVETFSLVNLKAEVDFFDFQGRANSRDFIFKKSDLEKFVKDFILAQYDGDRKIYEESLKIDLATESANYGSGKAVLNLKISGKVYSNSNFNALKEELKGKNLLESKAFLESNPDVEKARVELWPFWVTRIPDDLNKISFNLNFQ